MTIIKVKRGTKATIPSSAYEGEPIYCKDTGELFIGNGLDKPLTAINNKLIENKVIKRPYLSAHRGASAYHCENTLPAFILAEQMGFDMVETDVQFSSDNVPYLLHDTGTDALRRTTNGAGDIKDKTSSYLESLDAGSYKTKKFNNVFVYEGSTLIPTTIGSAWNCGVTYPNFELDIDSNKYFYFGSIDNFRGMEVELVGLGSGYNLVIEYWNGSAWTPLTVNDGTNNLTQSGNITWTVPSNMKYSSVNYTSLFWIRVYSSTTATVKSTFNSIRKISDAADVSTIGVKLPRLTEFLDWLKTSKIRMAQVEIKTSPITVEQAQIFVDAIKSRNLERRVTILLQSVFDLGLILDQDNTLWTELYVNRYSVETIGDSAIKPTYSILGGAGEIFANPDGFRRAKELGFKINTWIDIPHFTYSSTLGRGYGPILKIFNEYIDLVDSVIVDYVELIDMFNDNYRSGIPIVSGIKNFVQPSPIYPNDIYVGVEGTLTSKTSATNYQILNNTDTHLLVGVSDNTINYFNFDIGTVGSDVALTAEYLANDDTWKSLTITDNTNNLTVDGNITFTPPVDWGYKNIILTADKSKLQKYWIRFKTDTNPSTVPTTTITSKNDSAITLYENEVYIKDPYIDESTYLKYSFDVEPGDIVRISADFKTISGSPVLAINVDNSDENISYNLASIDCDTSSEYKKYQCVAMVPQGVYKCLAYIGSPTGRISECYIKNPVVEKLSSPAKNIPQSQTSGSPPKVIANCVFQVLNGVVSIHTGYNSFGIKSFELFDNFTLDVKLNKDYAYANDNVPVPQLSPVNLNLIGSSIYFPAFSSYDVRKAYQVKLMKYTNGSNPAFADFTALNGVYFTFTAFGY